MLATAGVAKEACGLLKAFAKVVPGRFGSVLSSNAFFLFWTFVAEGAKGDAALFVCCVGWPKEGVSAPFVLFERDANGLDEVAEPKGFKGVVEDEFKLANGLLAAVVFCDCVLKGFEAPPAGAVMAAANGLFMVASLFDVLDPPKAPPLFGVVEPVALGAFEEPKIEKLGVENF